MVTIVYCVQSGCKAFIGRLYCSAGLGCPETADNLAPLAELIARSEKRLETPYLFQRAAGKDGGPS